MFRHFPFIYAVARDKPLWATCCVVYLKHLKGPWTPKLTYHFPKRAQFFYVIETLALFFLI